MFGLKKLLLLTAAATSVFASADTVLAALKNPVYPDVTNLGTLADQYTGTSAQSLSIKNAVDKLIKDVNAVTTDTKSSAAPTESQAKAILSYIDGTLLPATKTTLTKTKNKRTAFTNAGLKSTIKTYLTNTKTAVDNLADALIAKAPTAALKSSGQTSKNNFDAAFNDAITYFS